MHRVYHTIKTKRDDISSLRVDMGNPGLGTSFSAGKMKKALVLHPLILGQLLKEV
jgi:hypothetical protein